MAAGRVCFFNVRGARRRIGRRRRSSRQVNQGAQAAVRRGFELDVAAMAARHIPGDCQSSPTPPVDGLRDVSSRTKARKTRSRSPAGIPGPSSSTVMSTPSAPETARARPVCHGGGHCRPGCRGSAVTIWPYRHDRFRFGFERQRRAVAPRCRDDVLEQHGDIGLDRQFGAFAAGEIEIGRPSVPSRRHPI